MKEDRLGGALKHVLAICDNPETLERVFIFLTRKVTIVYRITAAEIALIKAVNDLNVYDLIVISAINWRVPSTCPGLARHFRERFLGPMVAVGNHHGWQASMRSAGCTHTFPNRDTAARLLHDLLFPSPT